MIFYELAITIFWFIFLIYWVITAFKAKKTIRRSGRAIVIRTILFILLLVVLNSGIFERFETKYLTYPTVTFGIIGMIICAIGIAIAIWARVYLGKNWGAPMSIKENPELITSGPYKYIRHPIYAGVLLAMLGSALTGDGVWIIVFIFLFPYFILFSAKKEEENMTNIFPTQYPEYKKTTKMVIPFVL